jgi:pyruvate,water dikinase
MNQLAKEGRKLEDLRLGYAGYRNIDPNWGIWKLHQKYLALPKEAKQKLESFLKNEEEWEPYDAPDSFSRSFVDFIRRFGHLSDQGNDFSEVPWRERPLLVLDMVVNYDELKHASMRKENLGTYQRGFGGVLNWAYHKARESLEYKEKISFNYTKSYGMFRSYFLHLAKLFIRKKYVRTLEDIFYFTFDEIRGIVEDGRLSNELSKKRDKRKREINEYQNIELPEEIYGDEAPDPIQKNENSKILRGIPASGGYYIGKTCVVKGGHDFSKVTQGTVIIIPFSDISWTPIFAKAGAVISESGGILSHSATIAREYGIPSIVGVKGACTLGDGREVHVNGFSGRITIQ